MLEQESYQQLKQVDGPPKYQAVFQVNGESFYQTTIYGLYGDNLELKEDVAVGRAFMFLQENPDAFAGVDVLDDLVARWQDCKKRIHNLQKEMARKKIQKSEELNVLQAERRSLQNHIKELLKGCLELDIV